MEAQKFRTIPRDGFDVFTAMQHYPAAESWADIADAMDLPERWKDSPWAESAFIASKEHGRGFSRPLLMPKAHKVTDIFESAQLEDMNSGRDSEGFGKVRESRGLFVSSVRADRKADGAETFAPFFRPHASRYIKTRKNGDFFCHGLSGDCRLLMTTAIPGAELAEAYFGCPLEKVDSIWNYSFEAIRQSDGRTLIVARNSHYIGSTWVALLDAGETLLSMLSEGERKSYRKAMAFDDAAKACVSDDGFTVDHDAAKRAGISIKVDKY